MGRSLPEYTQEEINQIFARAILNGGFTDSDYEKLHEIEADMYVLVKSEND